MSEVFHTDEQELKRRFNETRLPRIQLEARVLGTPQTAKASGAGRSRRLVAAGFSALAMVVLLGTLSAFPASADQLRKIPIVGKIFEGNIFSFAGDSGIVNGRDIGLAALLNVEAVDKGVTIKLQDVLYDGARLSVGYEIRSERPDNLMFLGEVAVKLNGIPSPGTTFSTKPHRIDDNRSAGIMTFDIDGLDDTMNHFDLELSIGEVTGFAAENSAVRNQVIGEWRFRFPVANKSPDDSRYTSLADGYTASSSDGQFQVTGYRLTPATTQLDFRYIGDMSWPGFQLKDDRGMLIETFDLRYTTSDDGIAIGTVRFAPLAVGTKAIYATPYILLAHKTESYEVSTPLTDAFPIALSQGEVGEVIVNNVSFQADKTLIYYEVKGKVPYMQFASLWMETADGQRIISDNGKRTRISDTSYDYVLEYPALDPTEQYVLGTMTQTDIKLLDGLTVKLDVGS